MKLEVEYVGPYAYVEMIIGEKRVTEVLGSAESLDEWVKEVTLHLINDTKKKKGWGEEIHPVNLRERT